MPDEKTLAVSLMCLLSSIVLLGSSSGAPIVEISAIATIESGTTVRVAGVLVDLRLYDSGAEGMVIADLEDGAVTRIVSMPGIRPQPSDYVGIGDELMVKGDVSVSESAQVIFTRSDDILLLRESELILTVESISQNWYLFEGDMVRIKGVLERTGPGIGLRLYDCSGGCSIAVMPGELDVERFTGSTVTLTASLRFDRWLGALALVPSYAVPEQ